MSATLQNANCEASGQICSLREDPKGTLLQTAYMAKEREENHLQSWREFRGLTQEQLAERVGTSGSVISLLESGQRGLSLKWLRKLAPALATTPGHLLDHDPNHLPTDVLEIWASISDDQKPNAAIMLQTFKKAIGQ